MILAAYIIAVGFELDWPLVAGAVLYGVVAVSNVLVTRSVR